jgi:trehalose 6-phosphate synthase/phosphatase
VSGELGEKLHAVLARAAASTPGAFVERKGSGFAWHYRLAEPESGAHQAWELRLHLRELLIETPFEVLVGHKVVEVRPRGIHKGVALQGLVEPGDIVLAIGDDRTDEDLFAAAPSGSLTIRVGPGPSAARFRLPDVAAVRALLRALADEP